MKMNVRTKIAAALGGAALVLATPGVASAANDGVGQGTVGSAKELGVSAIFKDVISDETRVLRVVARFSNHKAGSVKLTKFRLCFSNSADTGAYVLPAVKVKGKTKWETFDSKHVRSGDCTSWYTINKTFSAKAGKELFVVVTRLGVVNNTMVNGFRR